MGKQASSKSEENLNLQKNNHIFIKGEPICDVCTYRGREEFRNSAKKMWSLIRKQLTL